MMNSLTCEPVNKRQIKNRLNRIQWVISGIPKRKKRFRKDKSISVDEKKITRHLYTFPSHFHRRFSFTTLSIFFLASFFWMEEEKRMGWARVLVPARSSLTISSYLS
jgi:hypothetical protein